MLTSIETETTGEVKKDGSERSARVWASRRTLNTDHDDEDADETTSERSPPISETNMQQLLTQQSPINAV